MTSRRSRAVAVAALTAAALILRLTLVELVSPMPCGPGDCEYRNSALRLLDGESTQVRAYYVWPPGYPLFLAANARLFDDLSKAPLVLQSIASAATVPAVYALGVAAAGPGPGLAAAAIFSFYPTLVAFTHYEWPITLYLLPLLLSFLCLLRGSPGSAGFLLGLAALLKEQALPFAPIAAAWLFWQQRRVLPPLIFLWFFASLVLPVTLYNAQTYDRFMPLAATAGRNLYLGNNTWQLPDREWDAARPGFRPQREVRAPCLVDNIADYDRCEIRNALAFMAAHPRLTLERIPQKWAGLVRPVSLVLWYADRNTYPVGFPDGWMLALRWLVGLPWVLVGVAGTVGLFFLRPAARSLFGTYLLYMLLVHAATYGASRFRLPLVPIMIIASTGFPMALRRTRAIFDSAVATDRSDPG